MEPKKELVRAIQSLPLLSRSISVTNKGEMVVSVYAGELTTRIVIEGIKKIKAAFPNLPADFYDILSERLKANKFSDEKFIDAVNNVIDNFVYPTPTIANFIGYDKNIRLYSYEEMLAKANLNEPWDNYKPVKFPDREKPVWIRLDDIKKYNLKTE